MSLFGDIASAIGHTVDSLAQEVGEAAGTLESLVSEFDSNGIDVIMAAAKLNLPVAGFLRGILDIMSGDPHQRLLQHIVGPVQPTSEPIKGLSLQWMQMGQLHQNTAQQIDKHMNDLFLGSTTDAYKSPAADVLLSTHQDYQSYFTTLVDHAQTQQSRHATLGGHVDDYLSQAPGKVYSLSAPMAALGVLGFDTAAADPTVLIDPQVLEQDEQELEQGEESSPPPIDFFFVIAIIVVGLIIAIILLIDWLHGDFDTHQNQQKSTPPLKKSLKPGQPGQGPQNTLTPAQEDLAKRLHTDYGGLGLSLEDIRKIIEDNPNLTEVQLRQLLAQYANVVKANPNLVSKYGALEVFMAFVSLSAYDPAHKGNYPARTPIADQNLSKRMEEAETLLGAAEAGDIPWPLTPSTDAAYEATDGNGVKWDVKAFRSGIKPAFNVNTALNMVEDEVKKKGENILINDTYMSTKDRQDLERAIKAARLDGNVIWWPDQP